MRPDLPWNVAGIPPEAREAARAAARREGLSVGEWLTRRILRSFSDNAGDIEGARDSWRDMNSYRDEPVLARRDYGYRDEPVASRSRETEEMLARVSRSEADSDAAYRRIEDQMRIVARRLDATERSQSENNRAMSKAAAEINVATREQAQAFDQLGSSVMGLAERLERIERTAPGENMKDAIKGLHQGLSRLADQIGQTANQSASQITSLAGNIEAVAGKLGDARRESESLVRALEGRVAQMSERVQQAERLAQSGAGAAERATSQSAQLARLQEHVASLEERGNDPALDKRLQGIERALADIVTRMEASDRDDTPSEVEESLKSLQQRLEAADKRHREAVSELRDAVASATNRLAAVETMPHPLTGGGANPAFTPAQPPSFDLPPQQPVFAPPAPAPAPFAPPPPVAASPAPPPVFDAPPFPENAPVPPNVPPFQSAADTMLPPHPAQGFDPAAQIFAAEPPPAAQHDVFSQQPAAAQPGQGDSFLAAARRSAQAAAAQAEAERSALGFAGFSWGGAAAPAANDVQPRSRYGLIGILSLLIVLAIVAGILLNQRLSGTTGHSNGLSALFASSHSDTPAPEKTGFDVMPTAGAHPQAAAPAPAVARSAAQAPSSPALAPLKTETVRAAPIHAVPAPPAAQPAAVQPPAAQPLVQASAQPPQPQPQRVANVTTLDKVSALANSGNVRAETIIGLRYLDGTGVPVNEAEAAKWLMRAAQKGEPVAEYRLGTLYERGRGVPADAAKAIHWYQLSAQAGNRKAMHNLAVAYAQGEGMPKDFSEAARWFSKAAALGLADSQFNLAVLYERGLGVPQSLLDAYKWYAIAASQGDAESKSRIDALATQLSADDRAAAQRSADMFKPAPLDKNANVPPEMNDLAAG